MQVKGALHVEEYAADDAEWVEAAWSVIAAADAFDAPFRPAPTLFRRTMDVHHGWDHSPVRHFVASVDGVPVAAADLELPEWDNRDLAWCSLVVHPGQRRRGHASELLEELLDVARQAGRTKLGGDCWETAAGESFALRHGFVRASQAIYRALRPQDLSAGLVEATYD